MSVSHSPHIRLLLRHTTRLLLLFYLLGSQIAIQGFSWCIGEGRHGHVEQGLNHCDDGSDHSGVPSCASPFAVAQNAGPCAGATECRHLPLTEPHRLSISPLRLAEDPAQSSLTLLFQRPVPHTVASARVAPRWQAAQLPPPQPLASQRYIVLTC